MRDEWALLYVGSDLLEAALTKVRFHQERKKWWMAKKEEVIAKIRAEGINVTESIVDELGKMGYSTSNSARGGPVIQIDAGMAAQVQEATTKVHEHVRKISEYDAWAQMLGEKRSLTAEYQVDHSDWMFFFGKASPAEG